MNIAVGVDIGGTNLRVTVSDESGDFLHTEKKKIEVSDEMGISRNIVDMTRRSCEAIDVKVDEVKGIGIASTGPLDVEKGILIRPTNLPFGKVPLVEPVRKELGIPTSLLNDCSAGVLGEKTFGAGKGCENLVYINIGTGIGGGAIVDGNLLLGKDGNAAEIGHFTVDPKGKLICGCGKKGHWEAYCSGRNIPNFVELRSEELISRYGEMSPEKFFKAVEEGDREAVSLMEEISKLNAIGTADVIDAYDPELVTFGGTVVLENEERIVNPIRGRIEDHIRNEKPEIIVTPLKDKVSLYGAIARALEY
ncbi:hypothetical protein AKJ40_00135 [candidate division MSBL1 archaeon SCGC-AAA259M10]|uniref:ROK family transcriptional regulator n=4 Tax=candidate division MSBL1 TaxID=215777 RepID=A0A133V366_9EURY|nr:hypothetical protein AKJ66_04060 [candidate division MSBL1 archaeon SCGC-AAA259E22]KXB00881.1 hypothetical protein AKJ40_00135 [candidate division MSBL1 archaeon SCGC-AAA259M10]